MTGKRAPTNPAGGFTLVEVIMAALILGVITAAVVGFFRYMSEGTSNTIKRTETTDVTRNLLRDLKDVFDRRLVPRNAGEVEVRSLGASKGFTDPNCQNLEFQMRARVLSRSTRAVTDTVERVRFITDCLPTGHQTAGAKKVHPSTACDSNGTHSQVRVERDLPAGTERTLYPVDVHMGAVALCLRMTGQELTAEVGALYLMGASSGTADATWGYTSDRVLLNMGARSQGIELLPPLISGP